MEIDFPWWRIDFFGIAAFSLEIWPCVPCLSCCHRNCWLDLIFNPSWLYLRIVFFILTLKWNWVIRSAISVLNNQLHIANRNLENCVSLGYGTDDWQKIAPHCAESAQTLINIDSSTVSQNPNLKGLTMSFNNSFGKVSGTLTNNGHAPTLKISKQLGTATLTGGPLGKSVYKLEHFHFGCENNKGSEHTVDG